MYSLDTPQPSLMIGLSTFGEHYTYQKRGHPAGVNQPLLTRTHAEMWEGVSTDHYAASLALPRPTPAFARAAELKHGELEHDRLVHYVRVNDAVQFNVPVEVGMTLPSVCLSIVLSSSIDTASCSPLPSLTLPAPLPFISHTSSPVLPLICLRRMCRRDWSTPIPLSTSTSTAPRPRSSPPTTTWP